MTGMAVLVLISSQLQCLTRLQQLVLHIPQLLFCHQAKMSPIWSPGNPTSTKHFPKSARTACASHLPSVLRPIGGPLFWTRFRLSDWLGYVCPVFLTCESQNINIPMSNDTTRRWPVEENQRSTLSLISLKAYEIDNTKNGRRNF